MFYLSWQQSFLRLWYLRMRHCKPFFNKCLEKTKTLLTPIEHMRSFGTCYSILFSVYCFIDSCSCSRLYSLGYFVMCPSSKYLISNFPLGIFNYFCHLQENLLSVFYLLLCCMFIISLLSYVCTNTFVSDFVIENDFVFFLWCIVNMVSSNNNCKTSKHCMLK